MTQPTDTAGKAVSDPPEPGGRLARTVRVLRVPNFRRYYVAQTVSLIGTWAQFTGQIWLVMKVLAPGNGTLLGVTAAFQSAPLILTLWGGSLADGRDKRRLLIVTQSLSGLLSLVLGLATLTGHVSLALVWVCAAGLGLVNAADAPARQAIIPELVGEPDVPNAIALNSASYQATRAVGVALAPVSVAWWGLSAPFLINAISFGCVVVALATLNVSRLRRVARPAKSRPRVREGLLAIRSTPGLLVPIVVLTLVAVFALNFNVTLPLLASDTIGGGLGLVSLLYTVSSAGAVLASLAIAASSAPGDRLVIASTLTLTAGMTALALSRTPWLACVVMLPLGASIAATTATINTLLQQRADPAMRGRVMAVYGLIMQGSSLIGGPLAGAVSATGTGGAPTGLYMGAGATTLATAALIMSLSRHTRNRTTAS
ncbi:MFS transporter [Streptomyces sp. NPDC049577]|uniref:MFS transporter n=1 Tax=Streptomyces sp. NPDC049577 TaxID=3155153 RepID=UPI003434CD24